jgi:hypothetical protein
MENIKTAEVAHGETMTKLKKTVSFNAMEHSNSTKQENNYIGRPQTKSVINIPTPRNAEENTQVSFDFSRAMSPVDRMVDTISMSQGVSLLIGGQVRKEGPPSSTKNSSKAFRITKSEFFKMLAKKDTRSVP